MRILDLGDTAFTIEFGDRIDPAIQHRVAALDSALGAAQAAGRLPGLIEIVPTFRSVTLIYDPLRTTREVMEAVARDCLSTSATDQDGTTRRWRLPAVYGDDDGPDLAAVAQASGLDPAAVVEAHSGVDYVVYMLGFLPGFPFMGDVPPALRLPRRNEPRVRVPAGSVAIATGLTAIYPWESPGGWHLLGRCPAPLFDATRNPPALLAAGDRVRFMPVTIEAMAGIEADLRTGRLDAQQWAQS